MFDNIKTDIYIPRINEGDNIYAFPKILISKECEISNGDENYFDVLYYGYDPDQNILFKIEDVMKYMDDLNIKSLSKVPEPQKTYIFEKMKSRIISSNNEDSKKHLNDLFNNETITKKEYIK